MGANNVIPQPDAEITSMENSYISERNSLHTKMGKLTVSNTKDEYFPVRPNFGTTGSEVILWANYFKLNVPKTSLFKYDIQVTKEAKQGDKTKGTTSEDDQDEVSGAKRAKIISKALAQLNIPVTNPVATEFKAHVFAVEKLSLPKDGILSLDFTEPGRDRVDKFRVKFIGPFSLDIERLQTYVRDFKDLGTEFEYPKFPGEVDALGVILGHSARSDPHVSTVGKSRYFAFDTNRIESEALNNLRSGSELTILRGYVQSVRMATGRLLLQTNVTHGVFRKTPQEGAIKLDALFRSLGLNLMNQVGGGSNTNDYAQRLTRAHKILAKSRIILRIPPAGKDSPQVIIEKAIGGLGQTIKGSKNPQFKFDYFPFASAYTVKFFLSQPKDSNKPAPGNLQYNTMVLVADYYEQKYGMKADPTMPLINLGTKTKPAFALAENCKLVLGQPVKAKLEPDEQQKMIEFACRSPAENAKSVTQNARQVLHLDNNPHLKSFGVSVDKDLVTVKGRELKPPTIVYPKGNSTDLVFPKDGGWNMRGVKVVKPGKPIKWTCMEISRRNPRADQVKATAIEFVKFMANTGINISRDPINVPVAYARQFDDKELTRIFQGYANLKTVPDLVIVFLGDQNAQVYNRVKRIGDVDFGIHTQCVQFDKIEKRQAGYFANVGLKVNLKFGGNNHKLKDEHPLIKGGKTMVVGYDVTHPTNLAPGVGDTAPSLVGLVASIDTVLNQWPGVAWQNPPRQEVLDEKLVDHFKSRLVLWRNNNQGRLPDNILIYRDGVSEGQFSMVIEKELPHIRRACQETYPGNKQPRITVAVSVKRHQTRFYPTDPNHIHFRSKSPKEGTIVDRGVTSVRYWDFYLQAHASLQGTARPAHYTVLLDEIFRADYGTEAANELQKLTHDMCYLYGRATKAVSICPPAYYADLICTRARAHKDELFDDNSSVVSDQSNIAARTVHKNMVNSMYYV
ncbi:ribonuclease H-like domain-containing protein [Podospora fimiseda]|uniref:Ribonuclease H-like domain-containing protein n=1 Tax=Podospora fimiseda TaxID=252190 RepID=A0AAN7BTP1_9PEZI|nr:ribonuclease H-like domain-containing protein [Podospora fimiseda]